ncbi:DUF1285 domain-containing protein [Xinfangfangia sp. D13-10-4-6]|uniref:DUF1285 domain-containing protein n=1 Tax=Pseudogemmobacter hezensis TaxID=2737662 RepID=UPI001556829B|nr:DUF1285 domain-containing protein [Pseudogemmobacter hezensis]NPD15570.1 DUF1285 domain-containing protein [Pseudogemmobacter hezensis]
MDAQNDRKLSAEGLAAAASAATKKGSAPPVHLWNPPFCGDLDMRIARDGTWFYLGSPIGREPLVRLFSSILKREGDRYFLVTPVEKVGITVEDLPLHAIDVENAGQGEAQILTLHTKTGDTVCIGPDHPIRIAFQPETGEPAPSVLVRGTADGALWARIDRKTFFRLVDFGCHAPHQGDSWFGLWSSGQFFPVMRSAELA